MLINEYANEIMGELNFRKRGSDNSLNQKIQRLFVGGNSLVFGQAPPYGRDPAVAAMAASVCWQVVQRSILFSSMRLDMKPEAFVIPQGEDNYHLAILIDSESTYWRQSRPSHSTVMKMLKPSDIFRAFPLWREQLDLKGDPDSGGDNFGPPREFRFQELITDEDIIDYIRWQDPALFFVERPAIVSTSCCSPAPGHGVSFAVGESPTASAGVYARRFGDLGVTLPMHIFNHLPPIPGHHKCYVEAKRASIVSFDAISDSCFAVFDDQKLGVPADKLLQGCLSGMTPRNYENCYFEALRAGRQNTNIIGWSPDIPFVQPYSQLKILTKPDTNPGDSGTALYNDDEQVLGFSFYRTGLGDKVEFSAWIWADSVFHAHQLSSI